MKRKFRRKNVRVTSQEISDATQCLETLSQLLQAKGELRLLLDGKSNKQIKANIKEFEDHHTMDGEYVSKQAYEALKSELMRRNHCALLNRDNRINQMIL